MTIRKSNNKFFTVLEPAPLENVGWEILVRSATDMSTILAHVPRWKNFATVLELNGKCSSTLVLDLDDIVFSQALPVPGVSILGEEHLWQGYRNGILRAEWFGEALDKKKLSEDETREVTVTGPGTMQILEWGCTLPPNYPTVPPFYWTFTNRSLASQWLEVLAKTKTRHPDIQRVVPVFDGVNDSKGNPWGDSSSVQLPNGPALYDYLEENMAVLGADFIMKPGFALHAARNYGVHLETTVIFHPGELTNLEDKHGRDAISNFIVAQDAYGYLSTASDGSSISKWGRREKYVAAGNALDAPQRGAIATGALNQGRTEKLTKVVGVSTVKEGAEVFVDYNVGDWVGVEDPDTYVVEAIRIMALTITVDEDGNESIEAQINTKQELYLQRLQKQLDKLGGSGSTLTAYSPVSAFQAASAAISIAKLDDLSDVNAPTPSGYLKWDPVTSKWVTDDLTVADLTDVQYTTPTNGQSLVWSSSAGKFLITTPAYTAYYQLIQDEGTALTARAAINFVGAGVTVTDDTSGGGRTTVAIPGGVAQAYQTVQDEGTARVQRSVMNFVGAGVDVTDSGGVTLVTIPGGSQYAYVQDEGVNQPQRLRLNFVGAAVTVLDDAANNRSTVSIAAPTAYYQTIQEDGFALPQRDALNFIGAGVDVTDSGGVTTVNVAAAAAIQAQDEGVSLPPRASINFTGAPVTVTDDAPNNRVRVAIAAPTIYQQIMDEGAALPARGTINFVGLGVSATDDLVNNRTVVTVGSPVAYYQRVQDEGVSLAQRSAVAFVGAGVTATDDAGNDRTVVTIPGASTMGYTTVQDEGTDLAARAKLNFVGAGVTVTDDAANGRSIVTITAAAAAAPVSPTFSYQPTLVVTVGNQRWYNDLGRALTIQKVRASVGVAPTGADVVVDVNKNGVTIFTTQPNRPTIVAGTTTDTSVPDVTTLADGDYLTVDIDQVGSTVAGAALTVTVVMV